MKNFKNAASLFHSKEYEELGHAMLAKTYPAEKLPSRSLIIETRDRSFLIRWMNEWTGCKVRKLNDSRFLFEKGKDSEADYFSAVFYFMNAEKDGRLGLLVTVFINNFPATRMPLNKPDSDQVVELAASSRTCKEIGYFMSELEKYLDSTTNVMTKLWTSVDAKPAVESKSK